MPTLAGKELALEIARLAREKKAENLLLIDLRKFSAPADFFVIGTALSAPHLVAVRDVLVEELKKQNLRALHADGLNEGTEWIVLDYFDVIVHLFSDQKRRFYDIEDLYADAPMERYSVEAAAPPKKRIAARTTPKPKKRRA
jgi:ribosome-associated protein